MASGDDYVVEKVLHKHIYNGKVICAKYKYSRIAIEIAMIINIVFLQFSIVCRVKTIVRPNPLGKMKRI